MYTHISRYSYTKKTNQLHPYVQTGIEFPIGTTPKAATSVASIHTHMVATTKAQSACAKPTEFKPIPWAKSTHT